MSPGRRLISIVAPTYNEAGNVREFYERVRKVMLACSEYDYELIFIDNASKDQTADVLRELAGQDKCVKVILNARNFGHVRSPYYGVLQGRGDAVICLATDLQDPPEMISEFIKKWEAGYKTVLAVKKKSQESFIFSVLRRFYYYWLDRLSDVTLVQNATGFGLYDRSVVDIFKEMNHMYPYFRGQLSEIGHTVATIEFEKPNRKRGITSNNFYTLYDLAMLGMTSHTKVPLRLATMTGFALGLFSLLVAVGYLAYKLVFWDQFSVGIAPVVIGLFFFSSVQLFFLGIVGEYIGAIHTQVLKKPLVVEKERINF